jgi:SUKH-3 immunity protein of toxin-antitoxin system
MRNFSQQTAECLNRSGWRSDRAVDTTTYVESLNAAGFVVHEAAADFLKEYGGLRIQYPHAKVADIEDEMHFDPLTVIRHITPSHVNTYSRVLSRQLCPIGEAARGYLTLMMDERGEVYASYDDFFAWVGSSGAEAIEALCSGRDLKIIPMGDDW